MPNTFLWFDFETFGKIPKSDRPAQFAAIRTDLELNEIGEPIMLYCKPALDSPLPSLESILITGISPALCEQKGVTEREFAMAIEREVAASSTIAVGYNNIRFDDEVIRFLFWRNIIDPYAREYQNNCSRWDLVDVVRGMYAFFPDSLNWPKNSDGTVSFKLSDLSAANNIAHLHAHDALSDVRATIALARLIKKAQPKYFDFCLELRQKEKVKEQLCFQPKAPVLHVSGQFGLERSFLAVVWPLAQHPTNKNEIIVWNLSENPAILKDLTAEEIRSRLFVKNEDRPENIERLPIKSIALNKSPIVVKDPRVLRPERAAALNIDWEKINQHAAIAKNLFISSDLWSKVYQRDPVESVDVEETLYHGFIPDYDRATLSRLRNYSGIQLQSEHPRFNDERLGEIVFRYRARNFPENLTDDEKKQWRDYCDKKCKSQLDFFNTSFDQFITQCEPEQKTLLIDVKNWVDARMMTLE